MLHGTDTIDFLFITHGLQKFLTQAGEMALYKTNRADHPALFIDLNGKGILANDLKTIYNFGQNQKNYGLTTKRHYTNISDSLNNSSLKTVSTKELKTEMQYNRNSRPTHTPQNMTHSTPTSQD
jgi:hypothetical protein